MKKFAAYEFGDLYKNHRDREEFATFLIPIIYNHYAQKDYIFIHECKVKMTECQHPDAFEIYKTAREKNNVSSKEAFFAVPMFKTLFLHVKSSPHLDDYFNNPSKKFKGDKEEKIEQIKEAFEKLNQRYCGDGSSDHLMNHETIEEENNE